MLISAVLLHDNQSYYFVLEPGKDISIGSGKKDGINVVGFANSQITIKNRNGDIYVNAKKAYGYETASAPLDDLIVLDMNSSTILYFSSITSESETTLTLPYSCMLKFGRAPANDVIFKLPFVSGSHFTLKKEGANIRVEDNGSTNGLFLNGRRCNIAKLVSGDVLSILTLQIRLVNGVLYFSNVGKWLTVKEIVTEDTRSHADNDASVLKYRRSPRTRDSLPSEDIVLAPAPQKGLRPEKAKGFFASIASPTAKVATTIVTSAASPALMAARTAKLVPTLARAVTTDANAKKRMAAHEQQESALYEKYGAYINDQRARIESVAQQQREILTRENPDPSECMKILFSLRRNLWERMPSDKDFLDVRIGMGYEDLCVSIKSREDAMNFRADDENARLTAQIIEENRIVDNLPARLSLKTRNTIGFIGNRQKTIDTVKNLIVSLTCSHFYEDVKLVGIFDQKEFSVWEPLKWLPHMWDNDRQFRTLAFDRENAHHLCDMFTDIIRSAERKQPRQETVYPPSLTIFLFSVQRIWWSMSK